jgi:hypothetical protein
MALFFLFAGTLLLVSAVRGTHGDLARLIKNDFTGPNNFLLWAVAVVGIGAIGYIPAFKKISRAFLGAILLGLFLAKASTKGTGGGFFAQLQTALNQTTGPAFGGLGTGSTLHYGAAATAPDISGGINSTLPANWNDLLNTFGIAN